MSENPNVALLREAYAEWERSKGASVDTWVGLVSDDFALSSLAAGRKGAEFTAQCYGADGLRSYLESLNAEWRMNFYKIDRFVAEGDTVVAIGSCSYNNIKTGATASTPKVDIWRFRDGKGVSFEEYYDTYDLLTAAGAA